MIVSFGSAISNKEISATATKPLDINSKIGPTPLEITTLTSDKIVFPRSALWRDKNQL